MKKNQNYQLLLQFLEPSKKLEYLAVALATFGVLGALLPYYAAFRIFEMFFAGIQTTEGIFRWSMVALLGFLIKGFGHAFSTSIAHKVAYQTLEEIRNFLADKLMKAPLGVAQRHSVGKLKNLMIDHVETIELPLAHVIPEGFAAIVQPLVAFIFMCYFDYRLALISLITIPLGCVSFVCSMGSYNKNYAEYMKKNDEMNSTIVEYVEGIEVVKAFNQSATSYEKFRKSIEEFKGTTMKWFETTWVSMSIMKAILPSTLLGVVPLGIYLYTTEGLSPSVILVSVLLTLGITGNMSQISLFMNSLKMIQFALEAVGELAFVEELQEGNRDAEVKNNTVSFQNVTFSYEEGKNVLHKVNAEFQQGGFYALVGPSGSGKSTMAKLIARFWDVSEGGIFLGDVNLCDISFKKLGESVSFVTQDNFLFSASLYDNIKVGKPDATEQEVYEASKKAMCHEFISKLDKGYETQAGTAGKKLSGGEKQRIAIARAILKDAPIVVLDEATAFTDPQNELEIQKSILELTEGKTLIVIAHRLSTIQKADKIFVLNNGVIESNGTHKELLDNSKLYQTMWELHISAKSLEVTNV